LSANFLASSESESIPSTTKWPEWSFTPTMTNPPPEFANAQEFRQVVGVREIEFEIVVLTFTAAHSGKGGDRVVGPITECEGNMHECP
jgi:hypothetical protein